MPSPILQDLSQKKLIKIRTFIIILGLIALSWIVTIKLTQQRVQLEGLNLLNNISQHSSPFQWDFVDYENDLVESSKPTWQYNTGNQSITADAHSKPHLSLNFSSEVINSALFDKLIINFKQKPATKLLIQFKTELNDEYYYYSPHISMTNTMMEIDLSALNWKGVSDTNPTISSVWGANKHKISSLVLNFTDSLEPIVISSIAMPFVPNTLSVIKSHIFCNGKTNPSNTVNSSVMNHFILSETCLLPSNYMWLKREVHQRYPGSVLTLENITTLDKPSIHRINKSYIHEFFINLLFYGWLVFVLFVIMAMMKYSSTMIKNQTFITAKFNFKPSVKAYCYVLIPSVLIFFVMNYFKTADLSVFKLWPAYFIWALLQQFLLVYVLAEKIFYKKVQNKLLASLLAALVFSTLHLPSFSLFILTFMAATFWSYAWLKHKKIIPLALSHSVLALMLYHITPDSILYSAKVFQWFWE